MTFFEFNCPVCGEQGQRFSGMRPLERKIIKRCNNCNAEIESDMRPMHYMFLMIYAYALAFILGVPFVLGLAEAKWIMVFGSVAAFLFMVFPLALMLHTRRVKRRKMPEKNGNEKKRDGDS